MNPVVVIPTFITAGRKRGEAKSVIANYDHATDINSTGELGRCLDSLENVEQLGAVIVLVAADLAVEALAAEKVKALAAEHPQLNVIVVGAAELSIVRSRLGELGVGNLNAQIGLRGYSAIRNLGLLLANVMGFDAVVFLDDDVVIEDAHFLQKAMYGLGKLTRKGIPILAKTGFYINRRGSYLSAWEDKWYNHFWQQGRAFNTWIEGAMKGPRLSRSNHVCGGCLALHREAFCRLAFDPWIPRGEDLDYMINLRMYGSDIWFDNQWQMRHLPPKTHSQGLRFRQDIYRWLYEYYKVEYSHSLIDLQKITAKSLEPYPGPFLEKSLRWRIRITAFLRSLVLPDKKAYRQAARAAKTEATQYGQNNCTKYFEFQRVWPEVMEALRDDAVLAEAIVRVSLLGQTPEQAMNSVANVSLAASDAPAPAPAAEERPPARATRVPRSAQIDPGATCEIRLNLSE